MATAINPFDQNIAEHVDTIETLVELLIPNEGDQTTVAFPVGVFHLENCGSYAYADDE